MRYLPISVDLFIRNRERFYAEIQSDSVAIFHANDVMPTNADGTMPFKQSSDLFYLSGIDQEETILVLKKNKQGKVDTYLYVRETNEHIAIWEGEKLSIDQAKKVSGIDKVFWTNQFDSMLKGLVHSVETIYLNANEHGRSDTRVMSADERFTISCKQQFPLHQYRRSAPILHRLRMVKSAEEIEQMKEACRITEMAFRRVLSFVKPEVREYEIEAEITHEFIRNRSRGHAYQPIIASGANACVLHYIQNDQLCADGDLILMDFGAEYANYNADLTRCIPANGKFTERQRAVYNAVLKVMRFATTHLVVGNTFEAYAKSVIACMETELIQLGLITAEDIAAQDKANPAYRAYFMHGISHSLGLDVHDVDDRSLPFAAGMVFTVEPGIYIREEKLGIRIENNILITEQGPVDLMASIPIEADEIEALMNATNKN